MTHALAWLCLALVQDATLHVGPGGNDAGPGTEGKPFATLRRARDAARGIDGPVTIVLHDGVHRLDEPLRLGHEDSNVTWKAAGGATPVVSGGRAVAGWRREGDRWTAPMDRVFRQLFVDGRRAPRARHPDTGWHRIVKAAPDNRTGFTFRKGDVRTLARPGEAEVVFLHDWCISRIRIASIDVEQRSLTTTHAIGCRADHYKITHFEKDPRYAIENAIELLDADGEWFLDAKAKRLHLLAPAGKVPVATAPALDALVIARGEPGRPIRGLRFEGITFAHTDWAIPRMGYAEGQASMYEDRREGERKPPRIPVPAAVRFAFTEGAVVERCVFRNLGGSALAFNAACRDNRVSNSEIFDVAANGILVGWIDRADRSRAKGDVLLARGNVIDANRIRHCGVVFHGAVGVWLGITAGTRVTRNLLHDLPYTGISLGWKWNASPTAARDNRVEGNHIHTIMQVLSDGGGIYTLGRQPGTVLRGNLIHGIPLNAGRAESNGIFMDQGSTDYLVEKNVIYDLECAPIRFHQALANVIRDNTLVAPEKAPMFRFNACTPDPMTFENNERPDPETWSPPRSPGR